MSAEKTLNDLFGRALKPDVKMWTSEWQDTYRYLDAASAKEPGKMRTSRVPFTREILDELSPLSKTQIVTFMKSAQCGATELGNSWVGSIIHHNPGPTLIVQPNGEAVGRFSKQRLDPLIQTCPALKGLVAEKNSKDGGNSIKEKLFPGGAIFLVGAHSPSGLRSTPARYLFLDEISNYEGDVGGEGDPVELARARTSTFGRHRKIFQCSTPKIRGFCRIETEFKKTDQRYYHVPCPECGDLSVIYFNTSPGPFARKKLMWDKTEAGDHRPKTAHLICENCGCRIDERKKTWMFSEENGACWKPTATGEDNHKGYHISGLYASYGLGISWAEIATKFLSSKERASRGDTSQLKAFMNNVLGETWVEPGTEINHNVLWKQREEWKEGIDVPAGGLFLTAGVDLQADRIEASVYAWGHHDEAWAIEHRIFWGNPSERSNVVWEHLNDFIRDHTYKHESGKDIKISYAGIDTGWATQVAYDFIKSRQHLGFFAVKGDNGQEGNPIVRSASKHRTGRDKRPVNLYIVGTFEAKRTIYNFLNKPKPKKDETSYGYIHYPILEDYDEEFFEQLTAERLRSDITPKGIKRHFVTTRKRNEALDCAVYAYAAFHVLPPNLHKYEQMLNGTDEPVVETTKNVPKQSTRRTNRPKTAGWIGGY